MASSSGERGRRKDYLLEEDNDKRHAFDKSGENDGDRHDRDQGGWIASGGFGCLGANESDTECGGDSGQSVVDVTFQSGEVNHIHELFVHDDVGVFVVALATLTVVP